MFTLPEGRLGEFRHLRSLGRAEVPHAVAAREAGPLVEKLEDVLVEGTDGLRPDSVSPPINFGYFRRSANTRLVSTRSGEKPRWKSLPSARPLPFSSAGFHRPRVVPTGRLVS